MIKHQITAQFTGGMSFTSDINGHRVITDTTTDDGGTNTGPSPKRLMLAALAGCTGIDIVSILNKMQAIFNDLSIDVSASVTENHPKVYDHVTVIYRIKIAETDRVKMEKAVQLSTEKYCGVSAMFRSFATVKHEIIYL